MAKEKLITPTGGSYVTSQEEFLEKIGLWDYRGEIINPLNNRSKEDIEHPDLFLLKIMRNPKYFYFTVKHILNRELFLNQCVILQEIWSRPFPMLIESRGGGKSFLLGLYAVLRALLIPGRKIIITGSGFRQSKAVFEYAEKIWHESDVLKNICAEAGKGQGPSHQIDSWRMTIGDSMITAIPIGTGEKIRGLRANDIIADEYKSIDPVIYDAVIRGFAAVNLDPQQQANMAARERILKKRGYDMEEVRKRRTNTYLENQSIISGTAFYQFNHFYKEFSNYKKIIESSADPRMLAKLNEGKAEDFRLDPKDYMIVRLPYDLMPDGQMSKKTISQIKNSVHKTTFDSEYCCVFPADSDGFFKRSVIETCVTKDPIQTQDGMVQFRCALEGTPGPRYIYGIDPASEKDNLCIVILEIHDHHRRVVYCWTTNKKEHLLRQQAPGGYNIEKDYNRFCVRKIRDLMKVFPPIHIAIDKQGGGNALREALGDPDKLMIGEEAIYQCTPDAFLGGKEEKKPKMTDALKGQHILELVQPGDAIYTSEANNGLRKDLESIHIDGIGEVKILLFPYVDSISLMMAFEDDQKNERNYDTLEDCYEEIEKMKDELSTIVLSESSAGGREHWDTPEKKMEGMQKGRMKKDRYSALLMANAAARRLIHKLKNPEYKAVGGFTGDFSNFQRSAKSGDVTPFTGPDWYVSKTKDLSHLGIVRKGGDDYGF